MDLIVEEELEIMSDPVKVVEGIRANAGSIDTSNDRISNKVKRVKVNASDGSPDRSPFLSGTVDVGQDSKRVDGSPEDDEQIYLESLYKSMLKQQEWLSIEIKKIQKSLLEKNNRSRYGDSKKMQKDAVRAVFKDDTAQGAGERGFLSRHNSEPEADSVDPPIGKRISSQESSERKESRSTGKKRQSRDFDDDQLSLCMPACQPLADEEVRTNDSVELNKASGDTRQGGVMKSNRSSGRSSFGNINIAKHPNMSGSCPDLYQQGLSQGVHMPFGHLPDGYGIECRMPRSKSAISPANCGHMGGFIPHQQTLPMQMAMPNGPAIYPHYGLQYNGNRMIMMPNQMMGQRYFMMDQYPQYRGVPYNAQQQAQYVGVQRMPGPVGYNPNMGARVDRTLPTTIPMRGTVRPGLKSFNVIEKPSEECLAVERRNAPTPVPPTCTDSKNNASSEEVSASDKVEAPKNVNATALPDIQDFDFSPEEFDAIFEGLDLPNI